MMRRSGKHRVLRLCGRVAVDELTGALLPQSDASFATEQSQARILQNGVQGSGMDQWDPRQGSDRTRDHRNEQLPWLADPSLHVALLEGGEVLALARGKDLVMAPARGSGEESTPRAFVMNDVERISCLEWLAFAGPRSSGGGEGLPRHSQGGFACLAVGTSEGVLLIYSQAGVLLVRQMLHVGPLLRLRARAPAATGTGQSEPSEELCAVFPNAVVHIGAVELQSVLRRRLMLRGDGSSGQQPMSSPRRNLWAPRVRQEEAGEPLGLPFRKWRTGRGSGPCSDAAIAGLCRPSLFETQGVRPHYLIVTAGRDPTIAGYRAAEHPGALSAALIASRVTKNVASAASKAYSLGRATVAQAPRFGADLGLPSWSTAAAETLITGMGLDSSAEGGKKGPPVHPQATEKGEAVSLAASLRDPSRHADSLTVSPRGALLAVTDQLGRVMLLDTHSFAVVRMWKGYRDARCAFLEAPLRAAQSSRHVASSGGATSAARHTELGLCLAIFAPRKGLIEVWRLRNGPRVAVARCGPNCRLLQPSPCLGAFLPSPADLDADRARAYVLHGDGGQLSEILVPSLSAADRLFPRASSSSSQGGVMSESDIFQRLCDLLRNRPGSLLAARQAAAHLQSCCLQEDKALQEAATAGASQRKDAEGEGTRLAGSREGEEERVALGLLESLATPLRKLRALDMLVALRPSLSPQVHLAAIQAVLASLAAALQPRPLAHKARPTAEQPMGRAQAAIGPIGGKQLEPPPGAPAPLPEANNSGPGSLTAASLRRRTAAREQEGGVLPGLLAEGGTTKVGVEKEEAPEEEEGKEDDWLEQSQVAQEEQLRQRLKDRLGALKWQQHLIKVFLFLTPNGIEPAGSEAEQGRAEGHQGVGSPSTEGTGTRGRAGNGDARQRPGSGREIKPVRLSPAKGASKGPPLVVRAQQRLCRWDPGADVRSWVASGSAALECQPGTPPSSSSSSSSSSRSLPSSRSPPFAAPRPEISQADPPAGSAGAGPGYQELTAGDFVQGFLCDPAVEPPSWGEGAESKGGPGGTRGKGLKLVDKDETADSSNLQQGFHPLDGAETTWLYGGIARIVFSGLLIGGEGAEKTKTAMAMLPLSGRDWQQLFVAWYSRAPLDQILAVGPAVLCRLLRRIECSLREAREGMEGPESRAQRIERDKGSGEVPLPDGGRWPLCMHWCQVSSSTGRALVLARACSLLADHEVEALSSMDNEEEEDVEDYEDRWHDGAGEDLWLERGADQWRELAKRVEDAFWLGRAVRYVTQESEARQLASRPRRAPSAAELASFPTATWVARLQLLLSHSAHAVAALREALLAADQPRSASMPEGWPGKPAESVTGGPLVLKPGASSSPAAARTGSRAVAAGAASSRADVRGAAQDWARTNQSGGALAADVSRRSSSLSEMGGLGASVWSSQDGARMGGPAGEVPEELLRQLLLRFPRSSHPDILAAHQSLELCRQWAGTPPAVALPEGGGGSVDDVLLAAQEHMAQISTVGLKGGLVSSMWGSLIGPRAASVVSLVQRLGRAPTNGEAAQAAGLPGTTAVAMAGAVAAYEQLLVLLYDCAMLAEAGLTAEPASVDHEAFLGTCDATCRDAVADFQLRPPSSERVLSYMLLLRTVGVALALSVDPVPLALMFPTDLLATFPALFQDPFTAGGRGSAAAPAEQARTEAKLAFLQAALLCQRRHHTRQLAEGSRAAAMPGEQYAGRSIYGLAGDLGVPHSELKARQVQALYDAGFDQSAAEVLDSMELSPALAEALANGLLDTVKRRMAVHAGELKGPTQLAGPSFEEADVVKASISEHAGWKMPTTNGGSSNVLERTMSIRSINEGSGAVLERVSAKTEDEEFTNVHNFPRLIGDVNKPSKKNVNGGFKIGSTIQNSSASHLASRAWAGGFLELGREGEDNNVAHLKPYPSLLDTEALLQRAQVLLRGLGSEESRFLVEKIEHCASALATLCQLRLNLEQEIKLA